MGVCKEIKINGEPCRAPTITGSKYCYWHDPKVAAKRIQARRQGGLNRQKSLNRPVKKASEGVKYALDGVESITDILQDALNDAAGLENSHARARTIGYLCQISLKALEVGNLEERVSALEKRIEGGKS